MELKKNGDGKFEATSIFLQVAQGRDTGTCAGTYKRVDTQDPGVPTCAEVFPPTGTLHVHGAQQPRRP